MHRVESMRIAYGRALVDLGRMRPDVVVLSADVANSDHSFMFQEAYPDRFYNLGIAEQSLVDVAAGLAYCGLVPFANTFAFLFATRALEMVRTHLCYGGANVKLMGAYGGLSDSFDGPTHHSVCDLAAMRSLPNMTVVVPSDPVCLASLLPQIADWPGPVFCRLNRNEVPVLFEEEAYAPKIGRGILLREGRDVALVATGLMVSRCLEAADRLRRDLGVDAAVAEIHTLKPLDRTFIAGLAGMAGAVVTAEEHSVIGGLGGAVAECLAEECPTPVSRVGVADRFAESGPYEALLDRYGLGTVDIVRAALEAIDKKGRPGRVSQRREPTTERGEER